MKKIFTPFILSFFLLPTTLSAQFGIETDIMLGSGMHQLQKTVPFHGGIGMGLFWNIKQSPLSVGWRVNGNFYGSSEQNEVPFYNEHYVHEVANITNTHTLSMNVFYLHAEVNRNGRIAPFVELGGGWASYKSRWSALDPYEQTNDDCKGYHQTGSIMTSRTPTINASAGINIKFHQWGNNQKCSGLWLTLACDYSRGNHVEHLNSKLNSQQFYYDMGTPPATTNTLHPRHGDMNSNPGTSTGTAPEITDDEYLAQSVYHAKHEYLQFRIGLTWFFGKCR